MTLENENIYMYIYLRMDFIFFVINTDAPRDSQERKRRHAEEGCHGKRQRWRERGRDKEKGGDGNRGEWVGFGGE